MNATIKSRRKEVEKIKEKAENLNNDINKTEELINDTLKDMCDNHYSVSQINAFNLEIKELNGSIGRDFSAMKKCYSDIVKNLDLITVERYKSKG